MVFAVICCSRWLNPFKFQRIIKFENCYLSKVNLQKSFIIKKIFFNFIKFFFQKWKKYEKNCYL